MRSLAAYIHSILALIPWWHWATLLAFALSLCVECLQWVLRVGFFELTDLVLNTLGAFAGAALAGVGRLVCKLFR